MTQLLLNIFIGVTWNVLFVVGQTKLKSSCCCYESFPTIGVGYRLHRMPATFQEAALRCSLEGAVLASPLTKEEEAALLTLIMWYEVDNPIYTGIHAIYSPGDFASMEGVPICKINIPWAPNQPDNKGGNENCIVLTPKGTLADEMCNSTFSYLCAKKIATKTYNCGANAHGYEYSSRTGSCYKFHKKGVAWRDASMTCQAEGGHLAVINNSTESEVLKELYAKHPEYTIKQTGKYFPNTALVGFHDQFRKGYYMTVHGQTLKDAGFDQFSIGQPDNIVPEENCGSIFRNGLLNDIWCHWSSPFICEITPGSAVSGCATKDTTNL